MARGFDSKFVEAQQEEAARGKTVTRHTVSPEERANEQRRRTLQLTRTRTEHDLNRAKAPAHREMLQQALDALDREIDGLTSS
jgi:hypothetical protein